MSLRESFKFIKEEIQLSARQLLARHRARMRTLSLPTLDLQEAPAAEVIRRRANKSILLQSKKGKEQRIAASLGLTLS